MNTNDKELITLTVSCGSEVQSFEFGFDANNDPCIISNGKQLTAKGAISFVPILKEFIKGFEAYGLRKALDELDEKDKQHDTINPNETKFS